MWNRTIQRTVRLALAAGACFVMFGWISAAPGQEDAGPVSVQVGAVSATPSTSLRLPLSDRLSYEIPAAPGVTTTIAFPDPVNDLHGAGFTRDPESVGGDFEVQARPGERYISVTPLQSDVVRNLNIVLRDGRIFALQFSTVKTDVEVPLTVFFEDGPKPEATDDHPRISKSRKPPVNPFESSGAARILGALDTMKMLMALPSEVELRQAMDLIPDARLSVRDGEMTDYGTHAIVLDRVLRLDDKDILVFALRVLNRSDADILVDPEGFLIRVGDRVYQQVTADVAPRVRKGEGAIAFVAMIGSPDGSPNWLDPDNDFRVSVALLKAGRPMAHEKQHRAAVDEPNQAADPPTPTVAEATPTPNPADAPASVLPRPKLDLQPVAFVPSNPPTPLVSEAQSSEASDEAMSDQGLQPIAPPPISIPILPLPDDKPEIESKEIDAQESAPAGAPEVMVIEAGGAAVSIDEQISIRIAE